MSASQAGSAGHAAGSSGVLLGCLVGRRGRAVGCFSRPASDPVAFYFVSGGASRSGWRLHLLGVA
eukprot:3327292-Pyramimonas_sp.AAC.1